MTQPADILLINAHVLTMDEEMKQYRPGAIAVKGDSILIINATRLGTASGFWRLSLLSC